MSANEATGHVPAWVDSGWVRALESVYDRFSSDPDTSTSTVRSASAFVTTSAGVGLRGVESRISGVRASLVPVDAVPARDIPLGSLIVTGIGAGIMIGGIVATSPGWALAGLVVLALGAAGCGDATSTAWSPPPSRNPPSTIPLYQDTPICGGEIVPVTLNTDFEVDDKGMILVPDREDRGWQDRPVTVTFCEGEEASSHLIGIRLRGHNRRWLCKIPPVEIEFLEEMPWFLEEADPEMKLVTECNITGANATGDTIDRQETDEERDQMALAEHLLYITMETLGVPTHRTRLGKFSLTGRRGQIFQGLGFFLENEGDMARRMGATRRELDGNLSVEEKIREWGMIGMRMRSDDVVAARLVNKLISNDDFSQNRIILAYLDGSFGLAIYDFDKSSLVWCSSAILREKWSTTSCEFVGSYDGTYQETRAWLQDRAVLGFRGVDAFHFDQIDPEEMRAAFVRVATSFLSRREDVVKVADHPLLAPESREIMRVQFSAFFDALEDTLHEISPVGR